MYPTKTGRGRPRRRPYAAHDARAVGRRARNAIEALRQFRWCLDGHPEVRRHWQETGAVWEKYWRENEGLLVAALSRLVAGLDDPVASEAGGAVDGD